MLMRTMLWKKKSSLALLLVTILSFFLLFPTMALADRIEGKTVVTLGEDLSTEQQEQLLKEMDVPEEVEIVHVSNKEEHEYLGKYISAKQIGTRAISSAKIILTEAGSGINVKTNNITWVTEAMLANAMVTAGVTDADVYITAPFKVSGTAGLTGVLKAFEVAAGIEINEEQKQVANEEMVRTAELAERIGTVEAAELLARLKEAIPNTKLETDEDYRNLILSVAAELGVELNEQDIEALIHLLKRLQGLNINWEQVGTQLTDIRNNLEEFLNKEETKNFIRVVLDFLIDLIEKIKSLFA